jgi:hypothetical protein
MAKETYKVIDIICSPTSISITVVTRKVQQLVQVFRGRNRNI